MKLDEGELRWMKLNEGKRMLMKLDEGELGWMKFNEGK